MIVHAVAYESVGGVGGFDWWREEFVADRLYHEKTRAMTSDEAFFRFDVVIPTGITDKEEITVMIDGSLHDYCKCAVRREIGTNVRAMWAAEGFDMEPSVA